jgi:hypothetical protein
VIGRTTAGSVSFVRYRALAFFVHNTYSFRCID